MSGIPEEAIDAALAAWGNVWVDGVVLSDERLMRTTLEAAAPFIAAAAAAAERARILEVLTARRTVLAWPGNGHHAEAVPFAAIVALFASLGPGGDPA